MNSEAPMGRRYLPWMLALAGLFSLRVGAQLVQAVYEVPSLPPFEAWQGSGLPYPALLASQAIILVAVVVVLVRVKADAIVPRPWKHRTCFVLGGVYFTVMAFRLFAGLTLLTEHSWFAASLPALFHIVLATFILTLGHYVYREGQRRQPPPIDRGLQGRGVTESKAKADLSSLAVVGSYPAIIALGAALYAAFAAAGSPTTLASYAAVLIGAALITLHELKLPYRAEWRPPAEDVRADALFLATVQVFGNNLIVWDILFGTRFLPKGRDVGPLGLLNPEYPRGFFAQMRTPFIRGLENG